jgi:adenosylmethionine-8-amino-7-oxononanoate aminotransferase
MEAAVKLARQYFLELPTPQPQRSKFIARRESYHGTTLGALSVSGHVSRRTLFEPMLLPNVSRVSACNAYRHQGQTESTEQYVARLAQELDSEFQRIGPDTVCAFVAEPIVGAASGCVPSVPGYFAAMRAVCNKYGALLIFDEVMCGMGRTGTLHAWEQEGGVVPDIQTIGKALGGGYQPVAAVLISKKVIDALDAGSGTFMHGQTYQGHPVACAAALRVQQIIREDSLLSNVRTQGALLSSLLLRSLASHPYVGNIRGRGLFWGIEFVRNKETKEPFPKELGVAMRVHRKGLQSKWGVSIYPGNGTKDGNLGDHVLLAPAYMIKTEEVEMLVELVTGVIEEVFVELQEELDQNEDHL